MIKRYERDALVRGGGVPDTSPEAIAEARAAADEALAELLKLREKQAAAAVVAEKNKLVEQTGLGEKAPMPPPTYPVRKQNRKPGKRAPLTTLPSQQPVVKEKKHEADGEKGAIGVAAALPVGAPLHPVQPAPVAEKAVVVEAQQVVESSPVLASGVVDSEHGSVVKGSGVLAADVPISVPDVAPLPAGRIDILAWVEWVAANMDAEVPVGPPSLGAVAFLNWAKSNREEFFKSFFTRLMPNKTQLEEKARFSDDGKTAIGLIERVLAAAPAEVVGKSEQARVVPLPKDRW